MLPDEVRYLASKKRSTPSLPQLSQVLRNTSEPPVQFLPTASILNSAAVKHHASLVEAVKTMNRLNMGTTTDPTSNINRRSMTKEYMHDRGRIIRVNRRLKSFGKIVNSEYVPAEN